LIHAQKYNRVLATLGQKREEPAEVLPVVGTTQENVITAIEAEIATIDRIYPELLANVQKEELAIAVQNVKYSWASHVQHRDTLDKIRRYSPDYFETVARRIDERSERYYVCQICGSVQPEVPEDHCPICEREPSHFNYVDPEMLRSGGWVRSETLTTGGGEMPHDKDKTVHELHGELTSAEAHLARLRDEVRRTESDAMREAHAQIVEAEAHLEVARARYTDIENAGRVGDIEAEQHLRQAYNDMAEAIRSALRYIG
jgi:rubrerythrin